MAHPEVGGHMVNLVSLLPPMFKCPFCKYLIRDAIQTYRGERACESCYYDAKNKGDKDVCPIDKEPIADGEIFKDNYARREILQLPVYCNNKHHGCSWEGVVNDIKNHLKDCPNEQVSCESCQNCVYRKDKLKHEVEDCPFRLVECGYCETKFQAQVVKEHEPLCHRKPVECPYKCGEDVRHGELYGHVQNCSKMLDGTICPYQLVGCKWRYTLDPTESLDRHMDSATNIHAALAISNVEFFKVSNKDFSDDLMTERNLREELSHKIEENTKERDAMHSQIKDLEEKLTNVLKENNVMKEKIEKGLEKVKGDLEVIENQTQANSMQEITEKLEEMTIQIRQLENRVKGPLPTAAPASGKDQSSAETKNAVSKIDELENHSAVMGANLADQELKLQLLENTSYDGRQLWKIDNVEYRMSQAVTGKVTALHSAPCFLRRGSYKFCSRLYLNGDGMGRNSHVSLFFVLMKSEYDDLLKWPFENRVTFRLINPNNKDDNLQESFIPDRNSSSFKRPTRDMNIAAGCPMFVRKQDLAKYMVDDVIFIETEVSTT